MKWTRGPLLALALVSCAPDPAGLAPADVVGVRCSSADDGRTCWGYGEHYADGTADSCGRVPDGPEFAMKLTWRIEGDTVCETVTRTSHPDVMPLGQRFCTVYLERTPEKVTYRFTDDPPGQRRHSYRATRAAKSCQPLIDALD